MGDILSGVDAKVTLGSDIISNLSNWTLSRTKNVLTAEIFGNAGYTKVAADGMKSATAKVDGFYDPTDSTGQIEIELAYSAGTHLTDLRLYVDDTNYYAPDTVTDAEAFCIVTSLENGAPANGLVPFSFSISYSGPVSLQS